MTTTVNAATDLTVFVGPPIKLVRTLDGHTHTFYGRFDNLTHHDNSPPCRLTGAGGRFVDDNDNTATSLFVPYGTTIEVTQ